MSKQIKINSSSIHLHLGCGEKYIDGFIHVDLNNYPHIDHISSINRLDFVEDNSVDSIYCSHTLEYFNRDDAKDALKEWHRTLKANGLLRLAVPDFDAIVNVYLRNKDIEGKGILGPLYGKWKSDDGNYFYHKTAYNEKSLTDLLTDCGFANISIFDPIKVFGEDFDDYSLAYIPHKDSNGILISLNLEAQKK